MRMLAIHAVSLLILLFTSALPAAEPEKSAPDKAAADKAAADKQAEREKKFMESLSGAILKGQYSSGEGKPLGQDQYAIESVTKASDNFFIFKVSIEYRKNTSTIPLALPVIWSGETPVITLDKMPIPGFGTFSARVLFDGNKYAGTWDGGDHGGHLFGTITKNKK